MKSQEGLTVIPGVPSRSQAISGMAHFSGGGPEGAQCSKCVSFMLSELRDQKSRYAKYRQMTGKVGALISGSNAACRYFQQKAK